MWKFIQNIKKDFFFIKSLKILGIFLLAVPNQEKEITL